jgi:hypothetical protein
MASMTAAQTIGFDPSVLASAVCKLRADERLNQAERAVVRQRGEVLVADDFVEPPPGVARVETTEEEDDAVLEDAVMAEADACEGVRGITREELFERMRGVAVAPTRDG